MLENSQKDLLGKMKAELEAIGSGSRESDGEFGSSLANPVRSQSRPRRSASLTTSTSRYPIRCTENENPRQLSEGLADVPR